MNRKVFITILCLIVYVPLLCADIRLPAVIGDHMIIQQNSPIRLWGWADPGEKILLKAGWQSSANHTTADSKGNWSVTLESPAAGGPYEISFSGRNLIILRDILAGEVWLASGQSNMAMPLKICENREEEIRAAEYPAIRLFHVEHIFAEEPQADCRGSWQTCSPASVENFSAVAYFFGRALNRQMQVPIGLISANKGGSPAEAWLNEKDVASDSSLRKIFSMWKIWETEYVADSLVYQSSLVRWQREKEQAEDAGKQLPDKPRQPLSVEMIERPHRRPGALYNAMIAPLLPFVIKGVIWYQGENNVDRPLQYQRLFPALIESWRSERRQMALPFYFVQIAPYRYRGEVRAASLLREAQTKTLSLPNTGMVVTADIGNLEDIHPRNKQDVGNRLALWALSKTYGYEQLICSGPQYRSITSENNRIRIFFDYAASGLYVKGKSLHDVEIAGENRIFYPADVEVEDTTIVVSSQNVMHPLAVRYGWTIDTMPNLYNGAGLPAVPFRTDDW